MVVLFLQSYTSTPKILIFLLFLVLVLMRLCSSSFNPVAIVPNSSIPFFLVLISCVSVPPHSILLLFQRVSSSSSSWSWCSCGLAPPLVILLMFPIDCSSSFDPTIATPHSLILLLLLSPSLHLNWVVRGMDVTLLQCDCVLDSCP